MASKPKRKKKAGDKIVDERVPKLTGLMLLFISFFLGMSMISYLFTWSSDHDVVDSMSFFNFLGSGEEVENWLGLFGAIISNFFIYWMFGLPSFLLVYMLIVVGWHKFQGKPTMEAIRKVRIALIFMVVLSVLAEFVFPGTDFQVGGSIGELICEYLKGKLGIAGLILFIGFSLLGLLVWLINPDFSQMGAKEVAEEGMLYIKEVAKGKRKLEPVKRENGTFSASVVTEEAPEEVKPKTLRPRDKATINKVDASNASDKAKFVAKGEQLSFEVDSKQSKKAKPKSLDAENASLEITDGGTEERQNKLSIETENSEKFEEYDPTLELSKYKNPALDLLNDYASSKVEVDRSELEANKDQIIATLLNYKIEITKIRATVGPTVTLYEIIPAPGVRISKIKNLEDDIALSLSALGIRIIAPIPGKGTIGIEVPNKKKQIVSLKEVLQSDKYRDAKMDLPIALGKTISDEVFVADLAKMPHLLVAGATGQGKSVGINTILMSLLYKKHPSQVKLVLIDPKKVELFPYSTIEKFFLGVLPDQEEPITTETNKVVNVLNSLCIEMDNRYDLLKKAHARNLREYNDKFIKRKLNPANGHRYLPFIVLVVDEFADLIMTAGKEVELPIGRLAQLARAIGIHLIIATQRPSVNIITGIIKANFPARIAFKVTSKVDSRTILDAGGADQLIGRGDMLLSVNGEMVRLQCAFVDTPEVEKVLSHISEQPGHPEPYLLPEYVGDEESFGISNVSYKDVDDLFRDAARLVVQNQHGSTSMIQRRLKLGYNRAGRIMDQLEAFGIVGPNEGSKAREVLIFDEMELESYLNDLKNKQ